MQLLTLASFPMTQHLSKIGLKNSTSCQPIRLSSSKLCNVFFQKASRAHLKTQALKIKLFMYVKRTCIQRSVGCSCGWHACILRILSRILILITNANKRSTPNGRVQRPSWQSSLRLRFFLKVFKYKSRLFVRNDTFLFFSFQTNVVSLVWSERTKMNEIGQPKLGRGEPNCKWQYLGLAALLLNSKCVSPATL